MRELHPLPFQKEDNGAEMPLHNSITGNFMLYQNILEELQLFTLPENSEWFSRISVINFEIKIVVEQKQA